MKNRFLLPSAKSGEVAIVLVLIIMILITLTTAMVAVGISTIRDTTTFTLSEEALAVSESGAENAILRLLRDPAYTGETALPIGEGSATITVTGDSGTKTIISEGVSHHLVRKIQVQLTVLPNGEITITGWREI